jgi:O-antigen/teichoic acid export membrane protein
MSQLAAPEPAPMASVFTADESSFPNPKSRAALVAYKACADVAAKGSLFVVTVVAARRLTPHGFGVFALGSTIGWMAAVAADFGLQMHLARAVARHPDASTSVLQRWLRLRCVTAAASLAIVGSGLLVARVSAASAVPIAGLTLVYAISGLIEFLHYFYRGLGRTDIESTLTIWQRCGTVVCGSAALAWQPTVGALAVALLLPVTITFAASLRIAFTVRTSRPVAGAALQFPLLRREFIQDIAPIGAGILLSALYFRIDVLLVQWWAGTEEVARYNAVFRLVEALRLFPAAVLAVALPILCRAHDWRPLRNIAVGVTAFAVAVSIVLASIAAPLVTLLFGAAYVQAAPAFRVLLLSFPLLSLNYALTHQLIGWNGQRAYAAICAAALAANVALNARLIPALSIEGAAWATLGTELVVTTGCLFALAGRSQLLSARGEPFDSSLILNSKDDRLAEDGALT